LAPIEQACLCDFQLVTNSNLGYVSYAFKLQQHTGQKSPFAHTPVPYNAVARGHPLQICWRTICHQKLT